MDENKIKSALSGLRRALHQHPEIAGEESGTAEKISSFLNTFQPDRIVNNIGGYGLVAEFRGKSPGPTVMFRCELDALPIREKNDIAHQSKNNGKGHLCGHDGHMAMVAGLSYGLNEKRPDKGRVILLFQPAEEDGQGAARIMSDAAFKEFEPDYIFALHNLPGYPLHQVILSDKHFASASRGMSVQLSGKSSHAAEPEKGINPALAMARLIMAFDDLVNSGNVFDDFVLITPIHARLGNVAYGTSPGEGVLHFTLRNYRDDDMDRMTIKLEALVHEIAAKEKLKADIGYEEVFPATINNPDCSQMVYEAAKNNGLQTSNADEPFRWSEDFGHFTAKYPGALFGLGSGTEQPALHNPDFDFPDQLIPSGLSLFSSIYRKILDD